MRSSLLLVQAVDNTRKVAYIVDTSCILLWLIEQGYEVVAYMADVGQEEVSVQDTFDVPPKNLQFDESKRGPRHQPQLTCRTSRLLVPKL